MSRRDVPTDLEQRIASALRRAAPRPTADLLPRTLTAITDNGPAETRRAPAAPRRFWPLALGATAAGAIVIGLFIGSKVAGPASGNGSPSLLASNSAVPTPVSVKWREPSAYSFTYEWCGGESDLAGRWHVRVESGSVVGLKRLDIGPVPQANPDVPTLGSMLAHVRAAEAGAIPYPILPALPGPSSQAEAPIASVTTDPSDGHPLEVRIDWLPASVDDEECYRISDYRLTGLASASPGPNGWGEIQLSRPAASGDTIVAAGYAGQSRVVLVGGGALSDPSAGQVPLSWYSDDGRSWRLSRINAGDGSESSINAMDVVFTAKGRLYAFASAQVPSPSSVLFESTDGGAVWTRVTDTTEPQGGYVRDVSMGGPGYVAVGVAARGQGVGAGAMVWTSSDGRSWRPVAQGDGAGVIANGSLDAVAAHAGTLVAVGSNLAPQGERQSVLVSSDARTWTEIAAPSDMHVTDIPSLRSGMPSTMPLRGHRIMETNGSPRSCRPDHRRNRVPSSPLRTTGIGWLAVAGRTSPTRASRWYG